MTCGVVMLRVGGGVAGVGGRLWRGRGGPLLVATPKAGDEGDLVVCRRARVGPGLRAGL